MIGVGEKVVRDRKRGKRRGNLGVGIDMGMDVCVCTYVAMYMSMCICVVLIPLYLHTHSIAHTTDKTIEIWQRHIKTLPAHTDIPRLGTKMRIFDGEVWC